MLKNEDTFEIDEIRAASRIIVRELGFMNKQIAGTDLSPSAVHAIVEIGLNSVDNARELGELLGLEKSTVSRLVGGLEAKGLLTSLADDADARIRKLCLTEIGQKQFAEIESFARDQVKSALTHASQSDRNVVKNGLKAYAKGLQERYRAGELGETVGPNWTLLTGYHPTLLGRVTEMHARYYSSNYGFGSIFECLVGSQMAEYLGRIERPANQTFSAQLNGQIVGSVTIDGEDLGNNVAHLRWFILDDGTRGMGIGNRLLECATEFVDQRKFAETRLWTFKSLDAARHLYEKYGFVLAEEKPGKQWGTEVTEQMFVRPGRVE